LLKMYKQLAKGTLNSGHHDRTKTNNEKT